MNNDSSQYEVAYDHLLRGNYKLSNMVALDL